LISFELNDTLPFFNDYENKFKWSLDSYLCKNASKSLSGKYAGQLVFIVILLRCGEDTQKAVCGYECP